MSTPQFIGTDGKLDATQVADFIAPGLGRGPDGTYYDYRDGIYERDAEVVTKRVAAALGARYSVSVQKQVEAHLLNITIPAVGIQKVTSCLDYIVLRNGVYWWRDGDLSSHDPTLGAITRLPVTFDHAATAPRFQHWLTQVLGDDPELQRHMWEIIGYLLMTGNPFQRMFLFHGEGGNGKGTLMRVLEHMLGEENISSLSLHQMAEDKFAVAALHGKIANFSGDISSRYVSDPEVVKQLTGGDLITAQHKYSSVFQFRSYAVPVFSANSYFRTSDASYGWRRRWLAIDFNTNVLDLADPLNEQDLFDEAPGIFNTAMEALRRLMARGNFAEPATAQEATRKMHEAADPFMLWLEEDENVYRDDPDLRTPRSDVYARYKGWSRTNGYQPLASGPFGLRLKTVGIGTVKSRDTRGKDTRYYVGIGVTLSVTD